MSRAQGLIFQFIFADLPFPRVFASFLAFPRLSFHFFKRASAKTSGLPQCRPAAPGAVYDALSGGCGERSFFPNLFPNRTIPRVFNVFDRLFNILLLTGGFPLTVERDFSAEKTENACFFGWEGAECRISDFFRAARRGGTARFPHAPAPWKKAGFSAFQPRSRPS